VSTVDDVYARMDDLVPPTAIEIEDAFLGAVFERDRLAARLAEVEAENAELIEKLKAGLSRDDRTSLSSLFGYDLGVEEGRAEGQAERDRLAQELEDAVEAMRKAARGPSPASAVTGFLARFPVKEGDGNG